MADLFEPLELAGTVSLKNRIVMAPMTRTRTSEGDIPNELMATYYGQRVSAGLIVAEVSDPAPSSKGYAMTPGIYTEAQREGWRLVTDEVHRKGGKIFLQIWHVGRMAHPSLMSNGEVPLGATEQRAEDSDVFAHGPDGTLGYIRAGTPRRLETQEVSALVGTFSRAFANARQAGFDGVEIHAANGYLFEQFMNSVLNTRTDRYGGPVENRTRFLLEVVEAAVREFGSGRVGVRLSPFGVFNSMPVDPMVEESLLYLADQLGRRGVAYMHLLYELMPTGNMETTSDFKKHHVDHAVLARVRAAFPGAIIWCGGFTSRESAQEALDTGLVDLIAFGRPFIGNPDLAERLRNGWPLTEADRSTYYTRRGEAGYTDFPRYQSR